MDEFTSVNILSADKFSAHDYTNKRTGNVFRVYWEIPLNGYKGKLRLEVNYVEGIEIRVSFEEVYDKACLRRLEIPLNENVVYNHRNPPSCGNAEKFNGIHKHKYLDRIKDGCAYVPDDIDTKSIESIVRTFAKECNIHLTSNLPSEIYQKTLF